MKRIGIILGSTRQNRFGETVAKWVLAEAQAMSSCTLVYLDLRDYPLPFYDEPKPPSALKREYSNPTAQAWHDVVKSCDAFVFVTPEYNHEPPAVLKNAIDYVFEPWHHKPFAIVSYSGGAIGGARAAEHLRAMLNYMGLQQRGELNVSFANKQFDEPGKLTDPAWSERVQALLKKICE